MKNNENGKETEEGVEDSNKNTLHVYEIIKEKFTKIFKNNILWAKRNAAICISSSSLGSGSLCRLFSSYIFLVLSRVINV